MKNTDTVIALNRLDAALSRHGVKLKRTQLLQVAAASLGYRNGHELTAADVAGDLAPPEARYLGRNRVPNVGWMHFFQQPDGMVFAVDQEPFDEQKGQAAKWILSPLGGLLDVSHMSDASVGTDRIETRARTDAGRIADPVTVVSEGVHVIKADDGGSDWQVMVGPEDALFHPQFTDGDAPGDRSVGSVIDAPFAAPEGPDWENADKGVPAQDKAALQDDLVYMTNATCEVANVSREDLYRLTLPWGDFDGEFYPLTERENDFIADDLAVSADGLRSALMGYSVLFRGRKHVMPTIEVPYGSAYDAPERDEVLAQTKAYADRIAPKVDKLGGTIRIDETMDDRICIGLMIPISMAMTAAMGDYEEWKEKVAWLMVDPDLPTVKDGRYPIRHEGHDFAVEVSWIGEGEDGDYQPHEDEDHPLLRFDAQRRTEGGWEDIENGSYCTQVNAYCDVDVARALARHLTETLDVDGGKYPKRLLEQMSWIDESKVRIAMRWQMEAEPPTSRNGDSYVAQETYGYPDHGTSIDLRRSRDGSIRCEVYVDLNCVDVFEGSDIDAIRGHLRTLPCDDRIEDGKPVRHEGTAHALVRLAGDLDRQEVRWVLVSADDDLTTRGLSGVRQDGADRLVIPIDEMTV